MKYAGVEQRELDNFLTAALHEDAPYGDKTSELLVAEDSTATGYFLAKENIVVCGITAALRTFTLQDGSAKTSVLMKDGARAKSGRKIATVKGRTRTLLLCERTALNLFQRLCGIATFTSGAVLNLEGSRAKLLDTRKTTPLMRNFEKYAVRIGGGTNHRMGLSDGILIKDNHIAAVGSIGKALKLAKKVGALWKIEIEVKNVSEFREAVAAGADVIMLDNMSDAEIKKAMAAKPGNVAVEVSGGITPERIKRLSKMDVDYISMGALTHSAPSSDVSFEIELK